MPIDNDQPLAAADAGTPEGTTRRLRVLSSFAYTPRDERGKRTGPTLWITAQSPQEEIDQIPDEVLQQHIDTGFAQWIDVLTNPTEE